MKSIFKSIFYAKGKLCVPYVWAFIFLSTIETAFILKMTACCSIRISDNLLLGLMAMVMSFIGIYSLTQRGNNNANSNSQENIPIPGNDIINRASDIINSAIPGKKNANSRADRKA